MNERLTLVEKIKKAIRPIEVKCEDYCLNHIVGKDQLYLKPYVLKLAGEVETPIAVIAIGGSVYPEFYGRDKNFLISNDPWLILEKGYEDITLAIVPEKITTMRYLRTEVSAALRNLGYAFSFDERPGSEKGKKEIRINTELCNGTKLELLLGNENVITCTSDHMIDAYRKERKNFCVMYRDLI